MATRTRRIYAILIPVCVRPSHFRSNNKKMEMITRVFSRLFITAWSCCLRHFRNLQLKHAKAKSLRKLFSANLLNVHVLWQHEDVE